MDEKPKKTARDLLNRSRSGVIAVAPDDSVLSAMKVMSDHNVGAVVVLNNRRLAGILSERDCVRKLDLQGRSARETKVREIMTKDVLTVPSDRSVDECRKVVSDRHIRHLPVTEDGNIVGVLSIRDVLEEVLAEDESLIHDLETERLAVNTGLY